MQAFQDGNSWSGTGVNTLYFGRPASNGNDPANPESSFTPTLEAIMEIDTQQMEAVLRLQEQQASQLRKNTSHGSDFETILNRQIGASGRLQPDAEAVISGTAQNDVLNRIMFSSDEDDKAIDPDSAVLQAAFEQASGALDLFDSYTRTLGSAGGSTTLRDAWGLLEGIDTQVAQIRTDSEGVRNAELESLLNTLEVMTTTEKFKFNRGDYII